jgi:heme-degrading monooxygenase HmoA
MDEASLNLYEQARGHFMIAREWKARCPQRHRAGFTGHLRRTGVHDATATPGFLGAQILVRDIGDNVEFTLITYWDSLAAITAFAGADIGVARLYPGDEAYALEPNDFVLHYEVVENFTP